MTALDAVYTPPRMAITMVKRVRLKRVEVVADFAAGQGALLEAAAHRWSHARIVANDLDGATAARLRRTHPDWSVSSTDFLRQASIRRSLAFDFIGRCDVVLLNPPFSCRGARRVRIDLDGVSLTCSPAMAFLIQSLAFLRPGGEVLTLLPAGCLESQRDSSARRLLLTTGEVEILDSFARGAFAGYTHRTVLVRYRSVKSSRSRRLSAASNGGWQLRNAGDGERSSVSAVVVRGSIQMHLRAAMLSDDGVPLVHSTELAEGVIEARRERVAGSRSRAIGPAILLPRVGQPAASKICLLPAGSVVALSDCVMAIQFVRMAEAERARRALTNGHWPALAAAYSGSCARFITVDRLIAALKSVDIDARFSGGLAPIASDTWSIAPLSSLAE